MKEIRALSSQERTQAFSSVAPRLGRPEGQSLQLSSLLDPFATLWYVNGVDTHPDAAPEGCILVTVVAFGPSCHLVSFGRVKKDAAPEGRHPRNCRPWLLDPRVLAACQKVSKLIGIWQVLVTQRTTGHFRTRLMSWCVKSVRSHRDRWDTFGLASGPGLLEVLSVTGIGRDPGRETSSSGWRPGRRSPEEVHKGSHVRGPEKCREKRSSKKVRVALKRYRDRGVVIVCD